MRNRKSILLLLLGIALLVALNVVLRYSGRDSARIVRRLSLIDSVSSAVRISLARGPQRLTLAKDGPWRLVEPFAASVDEPAVLKLLDALALTEIQDSVSDVELLRLGRTRADLSLEEPRLTVTVGDGVKRTSVSFGANTPSGDGVYAAVSNVDSVFVMPAAILSSVDLSVDALRRRSLFVVGSEAVVAFDIRATSSTRLSFVREGELWKMNGKPASAVRVRNLLDGILAASAENFVWPTGATNETELASASLLSAYGLDSESAVALSFKFRDGSDGRIAFGKSAEKGFVYALAQNGGAIVTVPEAVRELIPREQLSYTDARLFPFDATAVRSFRLAEGADEFVLARGEKGGWRLETPVAAPADDAQAETLLAKVLSLSTADLGEKGVKVSVMTNTEPVLVRREAVLGDLRFESLRSRDILTIAADPIRRLVVTPAAGKPTAVVYSRERGAWNIESAETAGTVDEKAVQSILTALKPLRATRIVKLKVSAAELDQYGLGHPALTVSIDFDREESVRRNILIGDATDGGRYATVGSSESVFVLSDETMRTFEKSMIE